MTLRPEDQVISLENAKRLRKLGCKQESLFFYDYKGILRIAVTEIFRGWGKPENTEIDKQCDTEYSAYTVAELGEMLSTRHLGLDISPFKTTAIKNNWLCSYGKFEGDKKVIGGDTEAEARAKMLIYLIENNLIDVKKG